MMILNMNLEVFGKMVDALTEERNLHFGRACVRLMNPELLDDCLLLRFSNSHILRSFSLFPSLVASISTTALRDCKGARPRPIGRHAAFSVSP
jgi:hypothetical protein